MVILVLFAGLCVERLLVSKHVDGYFKSVASMKMAAGSWGIKPNGESSR